MADSDDDRDHHDRQMVCHTHGCDHAVQRENGIQYDNLHDHLPEYGVDRVGFLVGGVALKPFMQFHRSLEQHEQTAENQDQIALRKGMHENREQRFGQ